MEDEFEIGNGTLRVLDDNVPRVIMSMPGWCDGLAVEDATPERLRALAAWANAWADKLQNDAY